MGTDIAIVLVDDDNEFLTEGGKLVGAVTQVLQANDVVANINRLVARARSHGAPIIHVPIAFSPDYGEMGAAGEYGIFAVVRQAQALKRGTWGTQVAEVLDVDRDKDVVVEGKNTTCAFASTNLDEVLRTRGIKRIALGGLLSNVCISSTMRTAYDRGYEVYTLTDCSATVSLAQHEAAVAHDWPMFSKPVGHEDLLRAQGWG